MTKTLADRIEKQLRSSAAVKTAMIAACTSDIIKTVELLVKCFRGSNKVLLCGNGGSAADAQHIAAEFVIRLTAENNRPPLPAMALTTDTSYLTAGSNDFGYESVFSRAIEAFGNEGDVLLAISTSGNSPNIINAVQTAQARRLTTVGFLGSSGGKLLPLCSHSIVIPSDNTQRIQEGHITAAHIICQMTEEELFFRPA